MNLEAMGDGAVIARGLEPEIAARFAQTLRNHATPAIRDVVCAFDSVAILYDLRQFSPETDILQSIQLWATDLFDSMDVEHAGSEASQVEIPVRYGGAGGPDLNVVSKQLGLTPQELIRLHSGASYRVLAVGFMPGFAYLGGLPVSLHLPRRSSPRTRVAPGSLGIGGPYTGIYPFASPGGWNLIGRTELELFDVSGTSGALLRVGDEVRFLPVGKGGS